MEENSKVHMVTDVSSTTSDSLETQQVRGEHGNVEMVIIVEELKEDLDDNGMIESSNNNHKECNEVAMSSIICPENEQVKEIVVSPSEEIQMSINNPQLPKESEQVEVRSKSSPVKFIEEQMLESPVDSSNDTNSIQNESNITVSDQPQVGHQVSLIEESSVIQTQLTTESLEKADHSEETLEHNKSVKNLENQKSLHEPQEQPDASIKSIENPGQIKETPEKSNEEKKEQKKDLVFNTSIDICEKSNDSQLETNSDISEKEHNKSISRELKSLIKSAKESKIISECTQLTSKTRKSRTAPDISNNSLNTSLEADKIQSVRRSSINSLKSNGSEKSEKVPSKRSMRSQNPEFVNKVKQFLNSVTGKGQKGEVDDEESEENKKGNHNESMSPSPKKKKQSEPQLLDSALEKNNKLRSDIYCWRCHWAVEHAVNEKGHPPLQCTVCPRSFHYKCLTGNERTKSTNEKSWVCPECLAVLHAESSETRSPAMKKISLGLLCELLQYALDRMMDLNGVEPFIQTVDRTAFPDYDKYVVHPMDLSLMKKNISEGLYGSTEAFLADAQWILHNSIIFNTCMMQSKLTGGARALVRSCRAEMGEIEACPECYAAAHARRPTWFTDVCSTPHMLLWAKLKGFPYWPAKGMSVNSQGLVDVRFFGAHDRAWVSPKDCYLYCEKDPNNFKAKRQDILESMQEAEQHIHSISRKYGKFVYPPFKTQFDPTKLTEQLKMMIPTFDGEMRTYAKEKPVIIRSPSVAKAKSKSRSNSKSSKSSGLDGDVSETEDAQVTPSRKMPDGAEIAREEEDFSIEKTMEVDEQVTHDKEKEASRKRRRSDLEEAVITIITSSNSTKRKKVDSENNSDKQIDNPEVNANKTAENAEKLIEDGETKDKTIDEDINGKEVPNTPKSIDKEIPINTSVKETIVTSTPVKTSRIRVTKPSTPKEKDSKPITPKQKPVKSDKSSPIIKGKQDENLKVHKRRNSPNKSLNTSQVGKKERVVDKKTEKDNLINNNIKNKNIDTNSVNNNKNSEANVSIEKANRPNGTDSLKSAKDRIQFDDDDTSLAVIAREVAKSNVSGLPTISSVRSLSTTPQSTNSVTKTQNSKTTTVTPKTINANIKKIEITVSANSASSIFTPTSTSNIRNMKEAVDKLQKLRNDSEKPTIGRVGVRAFARMTSPPPPQPPRPDKQTKQNDTVEIEVKTEPIDYDDAERQMEKMDLLKAFHLRPVNPVTTANLRDVRINKLVVAPITQKAVTKTTEVRIRAKKTFPQARKDVNESRSELNGKNSMVYIPIQPPSTQAPVKPTRPVTINGTANTQPVKTQVSTSTANTVVNTVTTPLVPASTVSSVSNSAPKTAPTIVTNSTSTAICVPTVGQVPTTAHTVPMITSVNGQWMFSLQPIMSVGGDGYSSIPANGVTERNNPFLPLALPGVSSAIVPIQTPVSNNGETTPGEPPRLQQRPPLLNPLDPNTPVVARVPAPSTAGPLTAKLNQNAVKLTDFFRNLLEDSLEKIDEPASQATFLKINLEQTQWRHQQEIKELKHNHELIVAEMRASFEKEKLRAVSEARRAAQVELEAAVKSAKAKQWCANCNQEAQFYCCWNTSYCDYPCQRAHWSQHFSVCTQQRTLENSGNENGNSLEKRLQSAPENLPKSTPAPTLAVGTKLTPTRVFSQDAPQKTSIIVSMVEDQSGNQVVKCVGTYKPSGAQQVSPLILNKQIMNNEEKSSKKVVTSGGYLIVGAGNNAPLVTSSRRTHPLQYTYNT